MARQGGLGRGLASLIPQKKNPATQSSAPAPQLEPELEEVNYFGAQDVSVSPSVFPTAHSVPPDPLSQTPDQQTAGSSGIDEPGSSDFPTEEDQAKRQPPISSTTATLTEPSRQLPSAEAMPSVSLTQDEIAQQAARSIIHIPVESVASNPYQPRRHFDENKLQELADSIKTHGVIQPLVVSQLGDNDYELIAGERRLEASKIAGIKEVPVIVKEVNDQQKLELALIENIQRHDLDVIEEARSYKQLQDTFSLTQDEIAQRVGKSRPAVANTMRLLNLPIEIQKALQQGKITEGHARTILAISNPEKQRALFELILKENLTVRQTEDRVREATGIASRRKTADSDPEIRQKEETLASLLGTKVKIKHKQKGGQVVIEYFSNEELHSLINRLSTQE